MADKTFKTRIQLLKNTDAYFTGKNPKTLNGELYIVEVEGGTKFKVGDGSNYNDLSFYEDNLLSLLGFAISEVSDGQILMYNGTTQKWENVDLTDDKSIIFLDSDGLSIKGYSSATQGQMLVKDEVLGLTWINPLDQTQLNTAVAAAQASASAAGSSAVSAGNSAAAADTSAQQATRINQQTMNWVNEKFWWGTLEEYNALESINEGTFYHIMV